MGDWRSQFPILSTTVTQTPEAPRREAPPLANSKMAQRCSRPHSFQDDRAELLQHISCAS